MAIEDFLHPLLKHYLEAPRWLKASAAAHAYAWLPQSVRLGSAYNTFRDELAASQGAAAVRDLATRKLEATLRWAIETVPAYRHRVRYIAGRVALDVQFVRHGESGK